MLMDGTNSQKNWYGRPSWFLHHPIIGYDLGSVLANG
jgi:hypothetical protein